MSANMSQCKKLTASFPPNDLIVVCYSLHRNKVYAWKLAKYSIDRGPEQFQGATAKWYIIVNIYTIQMLC